MRKTFLLSAVAVAASVVLVSPAVAAVADDAVPVSVSSWVAQAPTVSITSVPSGPSGYVAGATVAFTVTTSSPAAVTAVSDALKDVQLVGRGGSYSGTAVVKAGWGIGSARLRVVADYPGSGEQSTSSTFPVDTLTRPDVRPAPASAPAPKPAPVAGHSELALSRYGGPVGKQVAITLTGSGSPSASYWVRSQAFVGGKVKLSPGRDGKWHGTATVAKTASGPYVVTADCGADPARFWVEAK